MAGNDVLKPDYCLKQLPDAKYRGTNVLFIPGCIDNVIALNGMLDERIPFIEKPFSPKELANKVRAVLGPPASGER
jgi:hypothetical protein